MYCVTCTCPFTFLQNGLDYGDLGTLVLVDNHLNVNKKAMNRATHTLSMLHKPEPGIISKLMKEPEKHIFSGQSFWFLKLGQWTFYVSAS
jgi:hypothetical protein